MRWLFKLYSHRGRDLSFSFHSWIKTTDYCVKAYHIAIDEKKQINIDNWKIHVHGVWDRQVVLLVDFLPRGKTINSNTYCLTIKKLRRAIQNKRRDMLNCRVLFSCTTVPTYTHRMRRNNFLWILHGNSFIISPTAQTWHLMLK